MSWLQAFLLGLMIWGLLSLTSAVGWAIVAQLRRRHFQHLADAAERHNLAAYFFFLQCM